MSRFSTVINDYWQALFGRGEVMHEDDSFVLVTDAGLGDDQPVMIIEPSDGAIHAVVTPDVAGRLSLGGEPSESALRSALVDIGIVLDTPDCFFYVPESATEQLLAGGTPAGVRRLTFNDRDAFDEFQRAAALEDLDEADVELEHPVVYGSFHDGRIAGVASIYPWDDSRLADVGVLTLPEFRRRGHARRVVRSICRHAFQSGDVPQYRCDSDNRPSRTLAASAGFELFGTVEVPVSEGDD